jgi:MarR-like DNA-binding transcriptional regulator SgrR of sgrS sRNA
MINRLIVECLVDVATHVRRNARAFEDIRMCTDSSEDCLRLSLSNPDPVMGPILCRCLILQRYVNQQGSQMPLSGTGSSLSSGLVHRMTSSEYPSPTQMAD